MKKIVVGLFIILAAVPFVANHKPAPSTTAAYKARAAAKAEQDKAQAAATAKQQAAVDAELRADDLALVSRLSIAIK